MSELKEPVKRFIREYNMIRQKDTVVLGLSGGGDSVCLFLLLVSLQKELGFRLKTVTVDHGIRGEEGREDAAFAKRLSIKYDIPCRVVRVDAPSLAREEGISLEEAARRLRYQALCEAAQGNGVIAVAHHAMDQAETVLYRLIRGSGPKGLLGMQPVSQVGGHRLIRPLLETMPEEITGYLAAREQDFCTDSTNSDLAYARNRIRQRVLPELMAINPKAILHICQAARKLQAQEEGEDYRRYLEAGTSNRKRCLDIDLLLMENRSVQEQVIYDFLADEMPGMRDVTSRHVSLVADLLMAGTGKKVDLPFGMEAVNEYKNLYLQKREEETGEEPWELEVPLLEEGELWSVSTDRWEIRMKRRVARRGDMGHFPRKNYTKWFDYDKIKNGLSLRSRRPGDFFVIDGEGHRRKLKDYFIDEKIPRQERDQILLLASKERVFWILGRRTSADCGIDEKTREILEISIYRND